MRLREDNSHHLTKMFATDAVGGIRLYSLHSTDIYKIFSFLTEDKCLTFVICVTHVWTLKAKLG